MIVETTISYTAHRTAKEWDDLEVKFDTDTNKIISIEVISPNDSNNKVTFSGHDIKYDKMAAYGNGLIYSGKCEIPKQFKSLNKLKIRKKYILYGEDHWICYGVIFQHLTEGLNFTLNTRDGLVIKDISLFEHNSILSADKKETYINIAASQWISRNSGFSIVISSETT